MMRGILGLCAALVVSSPAVSAVALSDDFEAEAYNLNLTSLTNFTATAGNVDVVGPGSYSIACSSGAKCIDLDGSGATGGTTLTTAKSYTFGAGDRVSLAIMLSGNQRGGASDEFSFGFNTAAPITFQNIIIQNTIGAGFVSIGDLGPGSFLGSGRPSAAFGLVDPAEGFTPYSISFTAGSAGSLTAFVGTASADTAGPILDDFLLDISPSAVPEPASWAMMIGGFGLVGGTLRRRRPRNAPAFG